MAAFKESRGTIINQKRKIIFFLFLIILLFGILRLPFLNEPLERDEGAYAYMAQEILRGSLPYQDVFDHKPPVTYYLYATAFKLFSDNLLTIRLLGFCFSFLSLMLLFFIARKMWGGRAGLTAAFLYAIFSAGPYSQGTSSNTEVFLVTFLLLSFLLLLKEKDFWSGLSLGIALMIKPVAIFYLLVFLFLKKRVAFLMALVPCALISLYFYLKGAFVYFYEALFLYNISYVRASQSIYNYFLYPFQMIEKEQAFLWVLAMAAIYLMLRYYRDKKHAFLLCWSLASLLAVFISGRFYGHYFIILIPVLVLLSAFTIHNLKKHPPSFYFFPAIGFILIMTFLNFYPFFAIYTPREISFQKYPSEKFPLVQDLTLGVVKNTKPSDYIFFWGAEPELYFYTRRRAASRFITYYPLVGNNKAQLELLNDLKQNLPQLIIKNRKERFFGKLSAFVKERYRKGRIKLPHFDIFVLK